VAIVLHFVQAGVKVTEAGFAPQPLAIGCPFQGRPAQRADHKALVAALECGFRATPVRGQASQCGTFSMTASLTPCAVAVRSFLRAACPFMPQPHHRALQPSSAPR